MVGQSATLAAQGRDLRRSIVAGRQCTHCDAFQMTSTMFSLVSEERNRSPDRRQCAMISVESAKTFKAKTSRKTY